MHKCTGFSHLKEQAVNIDDLMSAKEQRDKQRGVVPDTEGKAEKSVRETTEEEFEEMMDRIHNSSNAVKSCSLPQPIVAPVCSVAAPSISNIPAEATQEIPVPDTVSTELLDASLPKSS